MDWHSSLLKAFSCFNQVGFNTSVSSHPELSSFFFFFQNIILVSSSTQTLCCLQTTLQMVPFCEHADWMPLCKCIFGWLSSPESGPTSLRLTRRLGGKKRLCSPAYLCVFASPVNMNFTVCCGCLSRRNAPPSPFNIMTLSPLIAFWEAHVVLTLASWLHFPWCIVMVLSFFSLSSLGKAVCLWAATLIERSLSTSVDNMQGVFVMRGKECV